MVSPNHHSQLPLFHPHILPIIIKYLTPWEQIIVSHTCTAARDVLLPQVQRNIRAATTLRSWYLRTRPAKLGDRIDSGSKLYLYLNTPDTCFQQSWQEWDGSEYPLEWHQIAPPKNFDSNQIQS